MTAGLTALGLLAAALPMAAHADPGADWTLDVGLAARVRPVHLGSERFTSDALPILEASYGDRLTFSLDDGAKATLWRAGPWTAGPVVEYRQSYNDRLPEGAFRMPDAVEVGGFASRRTPVGVAELRMRKAVSGYQGWSGDLAFDTGGQVAPKWKLGAEARLSWADSNFSREYFGLHRLDGPAMSLPRFSRDDFYSVGLELDAARQLGPRTALVAALSGDRVIGEGFEGPLLETRNLVTFGLGATYRFGPGR